MYNFDKLAELLDSLPERADIPASECVVTAEGETVFHRCSGHSDVSRTVRARPEDTYWVYSATKLFTCTAALRLLEEGRLALEDPVSRYLPEYARLTVRERDGAVRPARSEMLVGHLFTMTAGLDYELGSRPAFQSARAVPGVTTRQIAAALAEDPLRFDPGTRYLYSMAHDVLGAIVGEITGLGLAGYIDAAIARPLGMRDVTFHPDPGQLSRLSTQLAHAGPGGRAVPTDRENPYLFSESCDSGGAGILATATDYSRLPAALSTGGRAVNGYQVLRPKTVELMRTPRLSGTPLADFLARSPADRFYNYGLGVRVLNPGADSAGTPGQFGWDGAAGALVIIDPAHRVSLTYLQHVNRSAFTFQKLHPVIRETLGECITGRPARMRLGAG